MLLATMAFDLVEAHAHAPQHKKSHKRMTYNIEITQRLHNEDAIPPPGEHRRALGARSKTSSRGCCKVPQEQYHFVEYFGQRTPLADCPA